MIRSNGYVLRTTLLLAMVCVAALALVPGRGIAALIPVTTTADSGPGSLRQTIITALAGDTITFNVSGTITLTTTELAIAKNLTITGPGAGVLTILRSPQATTFAIFDITGGTVNISGLTISNGYVLGTPGSNGAAGSDTAINGGSGTAGADGGGGGIYNFGTLNVSGCAIVGNWAVGGLGGNGGSGYSPPPLWGWPWGPGGAGGSGGRGGSGMGGGIYNAGVLTLVNCTVTRNLTYSNLGGVGGTGGTAFGHDGKLLGGTGGRGGAGGGSYGGGLANEGTLSAVSCAVLSNYALGGPGGVGGNGGRPVYNEEQGLPGPDAGNGGAGGDSNGGGIFSDASIRLSASTVSNNIATGGPSGNGGVGGFGGFSRNLGTTNTLVAGSGGRGGDTPAAGVGQGGGIAYRNFMTNVQSSFVCCTIANNVATGGNASVGGSGGQGGDTDGSPSPAGGSGGPGGNSGGGGTGLAGGIYALPGGLTPLIFFNCTVSGNSAAFGGGSGASSGGAGGYGVPIGSAGASGSGGSRGSAQAGGIYTIANYDGSGGVTLWLNNITAGNTAVDAGPDFLGYFGSEGNNLFGSSAGGSGFGASDLLNVNPLLGPLQNNGGPTQTMALLPGSPAFDAGNDAILNYTTIDQRGMPRKAGAHVDIGAYELRPSEHADFNGDSFPDLVLQNSTAQQVAFWFTQGPTITGGVYALSGANPIPLPPNWQVVATGDFNGDGTPDLVLDNTSTGQIAFWFTSGNTITGGAYATSGGGGIGVPAGWQIVDVGDFNGDGKPDLVLQNPSSQTAAIWTMNGTNVTSGAYVTTGGSPINLPPGWQIVGTGDFNGDGQPDLVLDNPSNGQIAMWMMSGSNVVSGSYLTNGGAPFLLPAGWQIAGVGYYNGDGQPDLVLQNLSSRLIAFWYVGGTSLMGSSYAFAGGSPIGLPPGWQVSGPR